VGDGDRNQCEQENARAPGRERDHERDPDPDEPERSDPREAFEQPVQPADTVLDDPALDVSIGADQVGTICFVCSTSERRSNGLPTNACAPRSLASATPLSS